jgi:NAD(P)-dependent dehydrogenase (short-subunit alcohol dehydrogenase family)
VSAAQITEEQAAVQLASDVSIGRLLTAEEVAAVVVFLASPAAVAINGDTISTAGGIKGAIRY